MGYPVFSCILFSGKFLLQQYIKYLSVYAISLCCHISFFKHHHLPLNKPLFLFTSNLLRIKNPIYCI